jgi:hypothetical protein
MNPDASQSAMTTMTATSSGIGVLRVFRSVQWDVALAVAAAPPFHRVVVEPLHKLTQLMERIAMVSGAQVDVGGDSTLH